MPYNPIKSKPIAQQKQIADKQRQTAAARKSVLEQSVAVKKQWIKTEADLLREKQMRDSAKQSELLKKAYYKELQDERSTKE